MPVKGDQTVVRALNRRLILRHLREQGSVSRTELAELTGLSNGAITRLVTDLIDEGFLLERELGVSTGGRPPVLLDLDTSQRVVAGLKVMDDAVLAVLADIKGTVLVDGRSALRSHDPKRVMTRAAALVVDLLQRAGIDGERLVGVGVCLPGTVDWQSGICRLVPFLGWRDLRVAELLAEQVGVPVTVDNDVNALTVAESLFGEARTARDFAVVTLGRGVGAGLVCGGVVQRGATGAAGEFGHQVSQIGGRACECGKFGCLEAYVGETAVLTQARRLGGGYRALTAPEFVAGARAGDAKLRAIYDEAIARLAAAVANLINLLDPEVVVLGGEAAYLDQQFLDELVPAVREHVFEGVAAEVPLRLDAERLTPSAWARGAATLAIEHLFDPLIQTHDTAIA